jgi:hypothetical protein
LILVFGGLGALALVSLVGIFVRMFHDEWSRLNLWEEEIAKKRRDLERKRKEVMPNDTG